MEVRTTKGLSERYNITKGVLKDETLSPISYSVFISDLATFLKKKV